MLLSVVEDPLKSALNLFFRYSAGAANLHQHQIRIGCDAAIKAFAEPAVAGGNHRSHHAVPTRDVVGVERSLVAFLGKDAVVSEHAIARLGQIGMTIEAGIEKGNRDAAAGESFVSIHSQRRRQNEIVLLEN